MLKEIKEMLGINDTATIQTKLFETSYLYLGIPYPKLNKIASTIKKDEILNYLNENDFSYFELNIINSILISKLKDYDEALYYLNKALPYIDNWATSDKLSACFKQARKNPNCINDMITLINTGKTYYIRVALIIIMSHLLNTTDFNLIYKLILAINNHDYYVDMAIAWLLATMASIDSASVLSFLKNNELNTFINNKTLSKMRESFRITDEVKKETYSYKK